MSPAPSLVRSFAHLIPATPGNPALSPTQGLDDLQHSEAQYGYGSQDALFDENRLDAGQLADPTNRTFTYLMQGSAAFMYASFGRLAVMKFVSYLSASADVMAVASMEVDIGAIAEGNASTVKWRGKPVFIRHRTAKEIHAAQADDHASLRDPQTDAERFHDKAEWAVLIGVCTHLGCGQWERRTATAQRESRRRGRTTHRSPCRSDCVCRAPFSAHQRRRRLRRLVLPLVSRTRHHRAYHHARIVLPPLLLRGEWIADAPLLRLSLCFHRCSHGSHYDTSGRIRKGPAPLNLEVPQYKFLTDTKVLLG